MKCRLTLSAQHIQVMSDYGRVSPLLISVRFASKADIPEHDRNVR